MKKAIIIRYGEIHLKGANRSYFERLLADNIKYALKNYQYELKIIRGRYIITGFDEEDAIIAKLSKVFGIHSYSLGYMIPTDLQTIKQTALNILEHCRSFKVSTNRADKTFPKNSQQISAEVGAFILTNKPELKVDLHNPDMTVFLDLREDGNTYVYSSSISGLGGLPVGCSGKGMLMLSGGIDSPVAGFMMAKRGLKLNGAHFFSFPYTSELAKDKVIQLSKILSEYNNGFDLYIVPFTKIQEKINSLNTSYTVILMRRYMMRIANILAQKFGCKAVITGESLGQVASQTLESLAVTDHISKLPVFRPLIGMDKAEIIEISQKIETYDVSILPYDDCCTIFIPKHPVTKPSLKSIEKIEKILELDDLIIESINNTELIKI
ncbi:MAG TPA: tRNA 4-thiouridine(8) synthase ThiI [Clostridiales bacterium]|nr:tRNA 4-thiouridine(8) synthase ThiI [Clostridiales bacterium]